MTINEKEKIRNFRNSGIGYTEIAKTLNVSVNTVKSFCQRNGLGGEKSPSGSKRTFTTRCDYCKKEIVQVKGRKYKRFCSSHCRNSWWINNKGLLNKKANYEFTCLKCGKKFTSYGNDKRKYCCHKCYVADRFDGELNEWI